MKKELTEEEKIAERLAEEERGRIIFGALLTEEGKDILGKTLAEGFREKAEGLREKADIDWKDMGDVIDKINEDKSNGR